MEGSLGIAASSAALPTVRNISLNGSQFAVSRCGGSVAFPEGLPGFCLLGRNFDIIEQADFAIRPSPPPAVGAEVGVCGVVVDALVWIGEVWSGHCFGSSCVDLAVLPFLRLRPHLM